MINFNRRQAILRMWNSLRVFLFDKAQWENARNANVHIMRRRWIAISALEGEELKEAYYVNFVVVYLAATENSSRSTINRIQNVKNQQNNDIIFINSRKD
jgi:hypothetical protein